MAIIKIGSYIAGQSMSPLAEAFSSAKSYTKGSLVTYGDSMWVAANDVTTGEWDEDDWIKTNVASSFLHSTDINSVVIGDSAPAEGTPASVMTIVLED